MTLNRRTFLKTGAAAAAVATVSRPRLAQLGRTAEPVPPIEDPRLAELAARALDAAKSAGATYADIRLTHTRIRRFFPAFVYDEEDMEVGVRALVNGYWGFASGPLWSPDEMARLGREAVHQATVNAIGNPRSVMMTPVPEVKSGNWVMPVQLDPFVLSPFEIRDFLNSLTIYLTHLGADSIGNNAVVASAQDKAFASTSGTFCTQRCYETDGDLDFAVKVANITGSVRMDCLSAAGMGWELYAAGNIPRVRDYPLREEIRRRLEEAKEEILIPAKPIDVGRYDTVLDAPSVASLLDATLGRATELDRAMGYESNAGGTSYLNDPSGMIGTYQVGAPLLTLTANRSELGGVATVKWDDEGVVPDDFTLVKDGVLQDFQTTRESASWLKDAYLRVGQPARSHGCASAPSAIFAPLQHAPNLALAPGAAGNFDTLVGDITDGIAVKGARIETDFQHSSGLGTGRVFVIKKGKRVAQLPAAAFLFRSSDLWKSLVAVGGEASLRRYGFAAMKGEPPQVCRHSTTAAPVTVRALTVIDSLRKA